MDDFPEDPFEHGIDNALIDKISPSIGVMTVSWGFIDQYMSAIVEAIAPSVENAGFKVKRPQKFADKCDYLKKEFRRVDALSGHKARVHELLEQVKPLENLRHILTHGTLNYFNPATDIVIISKVNPAKDGGPYHLIESHEVSVPIILQIGAAAQYSATHWGEVASQMVGEFLKDDVADG